MPLSDEKSPMKRASPDSSSSDNKRRCTNRGSRSVANLSPGQLEKKRANDREAQRAIRERTKNKMEEYQRQIDELTSQRLYQELQQALKQNTLLEAENAGMKATLATILTHIVPVLGQHDLQALARPPQAPIPPPCASTSNSNRPLPSSNAEASTNSITSPTLAGSLGASAWHASSAPITPEVHQHRPIQGNPAQQFPQLKNGMTNNLGVGPEKLGLNFLLDGNERTNRISNGNHESHETSIGFPQPPGDLDRDNLCHGRSCSTTSHCCPHIGSKMTGHAAPVRNGPPTCPLDSLLLEFLRERQRQAADGVATPVLLGPAYPSVSSLLNPARGIHSHPLSKVFTDIIATFPDISSLPEKVAVLYIMYLIMRWQISPTVENYDRLPDWMTPRPSQLFTPHPAWIDHIPWPKMRDRLVRDYNPKEYLFDDWFIPYTSTLSVNWPHEPAEALVGSLRSDEWVINPVFERHLRKLENWSLGSAFAKAFPAMIDTYRLKAVG